MTLRILLAVGVVIGLSLGVWIFLRDDTQKQIHRWRRASEFFFEEAGDLASARKLNEKVLRYLPFSTRDLFNKALINERIGTPEALGEALAAYDRLLEGGDSGLLPLKIYRSRILRTLRRIGESRGTALSVMDVVPFDATMELGHNAMALLDPGTALIHFSTAIREHATDSWKLARGHEARASAYSLLLGLSTARLSAARPGEGRDEEDGPNEEDLRTFWKTSAREALDTALTALQEFVHEPSSGRTALPWLARLYEKRARLKDPGETPCWHGAASLQTVLETSLDAGTEVPTSFYVALGALRLQAAWYEADDFPDQNREQAARKLVEKAGIDFLHALGDRSPAAGQKLINISVAVDLQDDSGSEEKIRLDPRLRDRLDHVQSLIAISATYLSSPDFGKLLEDASDLSLAARVKAATSSRDAEITGVFKVITGFAFLRQGDTARATKIFDDYLSALTADHRPGACLDLATQCLRNVPESPFFFDFLDRASRGLTTAPLAVLGRTLRLLVKSRRIGTHAAEVVRRIDATLEHLSQSARSVGQHLDVARTLESMKGTTAAMAQLMKARQSFPDNTMLRLHVGRMAVLKADAALKAANEGEAERQFVVALGSFFETFVARPVSADEVLPPIRQLIHQLERIRPEFSLVGVVGQAFGEASKPDDVEQLSRALQHFFRGEFRPVIDGTATLESRQDFEPFVSFLRGVSHLELSRSEATERQALLDVAEAEFQRQPDNLACRLELANLELGRTPADQNIKTALLAEIESMAASREVRGASSWLLARALEHRIRHLARQTDRNHAEIESLFQRLQRSLRNAIESRPFRVTTYLALAQTFLLKARLLKARRGGSDDTSSPEYHKAVSILEAAPTPDQAVARRLATYLDSMGDLESARLYHLAINLTTPDRWAVRGLITNLMKAGHADAVEELLGARQRGAPSAAESAIQQKFVQLLTRGRATDHLLLTTVLRTLRNLRSSGRWGDLERACFTIIRDSWRQFPDYDVMRHVLLGELTGNLLHESVGDDTKTELRERMIHHYEQALEALEDEAGDGAILILNNLAWLLVNDGDAGRRARGLELAGRARAMAPSAQAVPNVYDTYAWSLYRNGRATESRQEYEQLLEAADNPSFHFHFSRVLRDLRRLEQALSEVQKALETNDFAERQEATLLQREIREALRVGEPESASPEGSTRDDKVSTL